MSPHDHTPDDGDTLTVQAANVEDALAEINATLGPDAQIITADLAHVGGFKGFFAREVVQLTARRQPGTEPHGVDDALEAMAEAADAAESAFEVHLRRQLEAQDAQEGHAAGVAPTVDPEAAGAAVAATEAPHVDATPGGTEPFEAGPTADVDPRDVAADLDNVVPEAPAVESEVLVWHASELEVQPPPGTGSVAWSAEALAKLGLSNTIVDAVRDAQPTSDMGWIEAVATALSRYIAPLPEMATVLAGARAARLGDLLGVPLVTPPDMAPYRGSFAAVVGTDHQSISWLDYVLGDRLLHVVIDEGDWQKLLITSPAVVSWIGDHGIVDALGICATLDAKLGFGTVDGFAGPLVRVTPLDAALAVRRILGRR